MREGAAIEPLDARGRLVSLPPNSAANAHFLSMLRYLLVQDWTWTTMAGRNVAFGVC